MRPPVSGNPSGKSTRRELNQFSKYSSLAGSSQKKAPRKSVLGGALLGFVAISVIYSLLLLGVTRVLRDAGVIAWSLSFVQSLCVSAIVVLVRTIERAMNAVSQQSASNREP